MAPRGTRSAAAEGNNPTARRVVRHLGTAAPPVRGSMPQRPEYMPNRIDDPNCICIFDTTMTSDDELVVARQLVRLDVDIIEAGFPASSPDDLDIVLSIAIEVGNAPVGKDAHVPVICGLLRCNKQNIDAAWEAVRHKRHPRIHTFIAACEIHMQHKLRKTAEQSRWWRLPARWWPTPAASVVPMPNSAQRMPAVMV